MINQSYRLNMIPGGVPVRIPVSQYDAGSRTLVFDLVGGSTAFSVPSGAAVTIDGTKPDGHSFSYTATASGSTVSAEVTDQMAAVAGVVDCQLTVRQGDAVLGSANFALVVERAALPADPDLSESDWSSIEEAIKQATQAVTAANASASAAAGSAATAKDKAAEATASATAAKNSETAAKTSQTGAAGSAATATTKAQEAANSASAAKTSQNAAKTSETNARNSASAAKTSQTAAAGSATTATTKAQEASTSAANAKTSETNAQNSAMEAAASAASAAEAAANAVSGKADKTVPATAGNIALLDANGNLADGGVKLPLPISAGGTGATTAEAARVSLGAAPSGFGLGDTLSRLDNENLNNVQSTGWYFAISTTQNTPVAGAYFIVRVEATDANGGNVVQTAYSQENPPVVWVRFKSYTSDDWGDWCCGNPPMREGIEYCTDERYNGNAVYCKYVTCGSAKDEKLVDLGLGTGVTLIRSESRINESVLPFGREGDVWFATVSAYDTRIELRCTAAWETSGANWYVKSFYVKQY